MALLDLNEAYDTIWKNDLTFKLYREYKCKYSTNVMESKRTTLFYLGSNQKKLREMAEGIKIRE